MMKKEKTDDLKIPKMYSDDVLIKIQINEGHGISLINNLELVQSLPEWERDALHFYLEQLCTQLKQR